jgi:hypothetical protein
MGPEGRRHRRPVGVEFTAQIRVIADEGVDQLQRGCLLVGLVCDKGLEARLIEPITGGNGKRGRECDLPDQPGTLSRSEKADYRGTSLHCLFSSQPGQASDRFANIA